MDAAISLFATDLLDEGFDVVLDNISQRGGMNGVTLAAAYHHARDTFPHNPKGKVKYLEGGCVFFHHDESAYGLLKPQRASIVSETDVLGELVANAGARGMSVNAWTVFCHNSRLGKLHPEVVNRNAYGDAYLNTLCPSHPEVWNYCIALASDIASRGVSCVQSESLCFHGMEHGEHHERNFVEFDAKASVMMGLCFCDACNSRANAAGVDVEAVRRAVIEHMDDVFERGARGPGEVPREEAAAMCDGQMGALLSVRESTVTALASEVNKAVGNAGSRFVFLEGSGAMKGYADGQPKGGPGIDIAWTTGVDVAEVGKVVDGIEGAGYSADPARVALDAAAYESVLGKPVEALFFRPMPPDCDGPDNLAAKVDVCKSAGLKRMDFYHYGFARLEALDWIHTALETSAN